MLARRFAPLARPVIIRTFLVRPNVYRVSLGEFKKLKEIVGVQSAKLVHLHRRQHNQSAFDVVWGVVPLPMMRAVVVMMLEELPFVYRVPLGDSHP